MYSSSLTFGLTFKEERRLKCEGDDDGMEENTKIRNGGVSKLEISMNDLALEEKYVLKDTAFGMRGMLMIQHN